MDPLTKKLRSSPAIARVAPFVIFLVLTSCQGQFGEASRYWFYVAKTFLGIWLVWAMYPVVTEMRIRFNTHGHASPVTVDLQDIVLQDGIVHYENEMVARVNTLTFRQKSDPLADRVRIGDCGPGSTTATVANCEPCDLWTVIA